MAYTWTSNTTPATGSVAMYSLIARLVAAGWTKKSDSDGTTYSATGVQVTSGAAGANGLANNFAWVRLQSPAGAGSTELVIQRSNVNNTQWRIKVSMAAGFTGGSPGATQVPSATDEYLIGGGTDASPTFAVFFGGADGTYRYSCGADNAAPYTFWAGAFPTGGASPNHAFVLDFFTGGPAGDGYTYAVYWSNSTAFQYNTGGFVETISSASPSLAATFPKTTPTAADWVAMPPMALVTFGGTVVVPVVGGNAQGLPANPLTTKDDNFPMACGRRNLIATPCFKGVLSVMQWISNQASAIAGDTQDVTGTKDRIIFNSVSLPWDGSVPTV
jgi:hypothetical protein